MNEKDYLRLLDQTDEKYLEEADPENKTEAAEKSVAVGRSGKVGRRRGRIAGIAVAASVAVCVTAGSLALFIPFSTSLPDVSMYVDSEYYSLIQKLNEYTYTPPRYKNNFEKLVAAIGNSGAAAPDMGYDQNDSVAGMPDDNSSVQGPGGSAGNGAEEGYQEVTDNQTAGVTEADRIKRSDRYIYYLNGDVLETYSISGLQTAQISAFDVKEFWIDYVSQFDAEERNSQAEERNSQVGEGGYVDLPQYDDEYVRLRSEEFFLSADCTTVTVISQFYDSKDYTGDYTGLLSLDVSDAQNIRVNGKVVLSGSYSSSRVKDGKLLLAANYRLNTSNIEFSDPSTYVPVLDSGEGLQPLPAEDVISPDRLSSTGYTVVMQCDEKSLQPMGAAAYISYSSDFYASADNVYFWRTYTEETGRDKNSISVRNMTEISCLGYGEEGLKNRGSLSVAGRIHDRYSLDEYEGILRVFTTTMDYVQYVSGDGYNQTVSAVIGNDRTSASLYCIDVSDMSVVAEVEDFAPRGETVRSARFDGDIAYVCTAVQVTDPVFFFDLSHLDNITYRQTGTIAGFSTSLIDFGENSLVGIGVDEDGDLKIEAYTGEQGSILSVDKIIFESCSYSPYYKSYYIDRENGLIGLGVCRRGDFGNAYYYLVVGFDGSRFELLSYSPLAGDCEDMRGVYIDGYFYMFGAYDFKVTELELPDGLKA